MAAERLAEYAEVIGPERMLVVVEAGCVDLGRGRIRQARDRFAEAQAGLIGLPVPGWPMLCSLGLIRALALLGETAAARRAAAELTARRHPAFGWREPEIQTALAWVEASEGAVSRAIASARRAAEFAAERELYAQEASALHAAVCFGDRGAALAVGDPAALLAASAAFERMGDPLSAADAAAHAAWAASQRGSRRPATAAALLLERLAPARAGVRTPALQAARAGRFRSPNANAR